MPTARQINKKDQILYKNLVNDAKNRLTDKYPELNLDKFIQPLEMIKEDQDFWNTTLDGLVILLNDQKCVVYKLNTSIKELCYVADVFYLRSLQEYFQVDKDYYVLSIDATDFSLYKGNRIGVSEVKFEEDQPNTYDKIINKGSEEKHQSVRTAGRNTSVYSTGIDRSNASTKGLEKYFRYVDKFIIDNFYKDHKIPLFLVAPDIYHSEIKQLSNNQYLSPSCFSGTFNTHADNKVKQNIDAVMTENFIKENKAMIEEYAFSPLLTDNIGTIIENITNKQIQMLIFKSDFSLNGKIDFNDNNISQASDNDLLNDLLVLALRNHVLVAILPNDSLKLSGGVLAILRNFN